MAGRDSIGNAPGTAGWLVVTSPIYEPPDDGALRSRKHKIRHSACLHWEATEGLSAVAGVGRDHWHPLAASTAPFK